MPSLRILCVILMLTLSLGLAGHSGATTLTFHASFPTQTAPAPINPCDDIDCEGEKTFSNPFSFPQFGLAGKTLLSVLISYDLQTTTETIGTNNQSVAGSFHGDAESLVSLGGAGLPPFSARSDTQSERTAILQPGQSMSLATATARILNSVTVAIGNTDFPLFLGSGNLGYAGNFDSFEGSVRDLNGCGGFDCHSVNPILFTYTFSGAMDLSYTYCTPGIDLGCPSSDPAFYSQGSTSFFTTPANATPIPALTFDEATGSSGTNQSNQTVGWRFDVLHPFTLNELGWFDEGRDGLGHSHTVDLWDPSGTLLASAVVPAGTAASLNGQYRMVGISPITLAPGTGYIIGGDNFDTSGDRLAFDVTQSVRTDFISYDGPTFSILGTGLVRPTQDSIPDTGFYGPMFGGAIPGPSTLALVGLGVVMLVSAAKFGRCSSVYK